MNEDFESDSAPEVTHRAPTTVSTPPPNRILEGLKEHFIEEEAEQKETDDAVDQIEKGLLDGEVSEEDLEGLQQQVKDEEAGDEQGVPYEQLAENYENLQRALRAERFQARQTAEQAAQQAAMQAYNLALQQMAPQNQPIDVNDDPVGFFQQQVQNLQAQTQAQQVAMQTYLQEQQQVAEHAQLKTIAEQAEQEFHERLPGGEPEYEAALDHWRGSRFQELQMIHPNASEELIMATIQNDEAAIVAQASRLGVAPPAYAYQMAMSRGYRPGMYYQQEQGIDDEGRDLPPRATNGRFMARDFDELREEGRQYAQSLSGAGRPAQDQSVERMLHMDNDEFGKAWSKMKKSKANPIFR